jgi:hypothetical protein
MRIGERPVRNAGLTQWKLFWSDRMEIQDVTHTQQGCGERGNATFFRCRELRGISTDLLTAREKIGEGLRGGCFYGLLHRPTV